MTQVATITDYRDVPAAIRDVTDAAVLVVCKIRAWTGVRRDRDVTRQAIDANRARSGAGRFDKFLLGSHSLRSIMGAMGEIRRFVYKHSLPWGEMEGVRLLPTANYVQFVNGLSPLQDAYEDAVRAFVVAYPDLIEESRARLGDMFRIEDYPDVDALQHGFTVSIGFMPMPKVDDFRVDLSARHVEGLKRQIEAGVKADVQAAMADLWERLHEGVGALLRQLDRIDEGVAVPAGEGRHAGWVNSRTLTNLHELINLLPRLNVTGDPRLEAACETLRAQLQGVSATDLKEDPERRRKAKLAADDILSMMGITAAAA
jgi:hypothetical protein